MTTSRLTVVLRDRREEESVVPSGLKKYLIAVVAIAVVAVLPLIHSGSYFQLQLETICIYVMATIGLNVAFGYAGEFFLSQPAVLAVSAYGTAVLTTEQHWSLWLALPSVVVMGTVVGVCLGLPGLRVRGLYLGLISLFGLLVVSDLPLVWQGVLGGSDGLVGLPVVSGGGRIFYEITLGGVVVVVVALWNLLRSSWGLRLRALRDAPSALVTTGFDAGTTRVIVYAASSLIASLAGWYLAQAEGSVVPSEFSLNLILILLAGAVIGGRGTLFGPIVGAAIIEGYTQFVNAFSAWNIVGLGLLLFVVIVVAPEGVRQLVRKRYAQLFKKQDRLSLKHLGALAGEIVDPSNPRSPMQSSEAFEGASRTEFSNRPDLGSTARLVLDVKAVRKSFGGVEVLSGVDLSVASGQIVGLIGTNGSGKTTLVNVVTGVLAADSATIEVAGRDVTGLSAARRARAGIARTFQVPQLIEDLSVRENIELGIAYHLRDSLLASLTRSRGLRRRVVERRAIVDNICAELRLSDIGSRDARLLPLGLRRIVEVGRAIATGAQVICLDEPAAGLEEDELPRLAAALKGLARSGRGVLLIEHNVGFLMSIADTVLLLSDGQVIERAENLLPEQLPVAIAEYVREVPL